jgi:ketosteroid isomerase-like protein
MSQENVEIVRHAIDAFNRADVEAAMQHFATDIDWHDQRELPGAQIHHGHAGVLGHLRSTVEDMADYHAEVKAARELRDHVIVGALVSARGRTSGLAVERETFTVFTLDGGLITRVEIFGSETEALEAVGLSEQDAHADS